MDKYENHRDEWKREDMKEERVVIYDPRDPRYIATEEPEERTCPSCGDSMEGVAEEFETCHSCFFSDPNNEQ